MSQRQPCDMVAATLVCQERIPDRCYFIDEVYGRKRIPRPRRAFATESGGV